MEGGRMVRVMAILTSLLLLSDTTIHLEQVPMALPPLVGKSDAEIVKAVEQEALVFPSEAAPSRLKRAFSAARSSGSERRVCTEASGVGPVRSGEFVIGGELSGPVSNNGPKRIAPKIWWSPLHHSGSMQLDVRARRLGSPEEYRFHSTRVAWSAASSARPVPDNDKEYFFPSGIEFLHSGRWLLVATQGADWGCFILTLPVPSL